MDPRIWGKLPRELLEHILSFLALKTFLNLRSTCKHFNSLIFSPSFISKHSASSLPSFLLLSHPQSSQKFSLYDSTLGNWCSSFLWSSQFLPGNSKSSTLLSISNGLFCLSLPGSFAFLVCNFLTKCSRKIDYPSFPFSFVFLTFVSTGLGYQIFVTTHSTAFLYDSRFHLWRRFRLDAHDLILSDSSYQEGVYFNGSLYFTVSDSGPFSILCLNPGNGKLDSQAIDLPENLTFLRLVSDGERKLYMVGGVGTNGISRMMKLWELDGDGEGRKRWIEVGILPELMCRKFMSVCYHTYEHVYCLWHRGMICICCYTWPEILYYKVGRGTWHWLPKCPSLPEKWSCGFRWFSFLPEISAAV
ncbi:hypothetical protein SAY86_006827 [Trapa natans]|uniref:F-box domain-containing protein n=1 Tax=Trapa natans TaxID=22666 RepID=A0AAN7QTL5_TRANT|nr:hypothetical protein SAY86_006827 [Trapa natans]